MPDFKPTLTSDRCISAEVQALFNVTTQGDRWVYETRRMGGGSCKRSKSFYSVAPTGQDKSWRKYDWLKQPDWKEGEPYKPADALYSIPRRYPCLTR